MYYSNIIWVDYNDRSFIKEKYTKESNECAKLTLDKL
jgi:hypothetical protein